MLINSIVNSKFNSVTYVLSDSGHRGVWLVDCGDVEELNVSDVTGVLLTHIHYDHIYGINRLLERFPDAKIYTNDFGKEGLSNPRLNLSKYFPDGELFTIAKPESVYSLEGKPVLSILGCEARILSVPGHDPSCLAFLIDGKLFTGDALIPGEKVIASFPRSNRAEAKASEQQLLELGKHHIILPGHAIKNDD